MCFKIFVDLVMICDCLRNIKYDEHGLKYIYILFIYTQGFYEIYEEKKNMLYLQFCEFKIFDP